MERPKAIDPRVIDSLYRLPLGELLALRAQTTDARELAHLDGKILVARALEQEELQSIKKRCWVVWKFESQNEWFLNPVVAARRLLGE